MDDCGNGRDEDGKTCEHCNGTGYCPQIKKAD
jgi:hypothetical protein